MNSKIDLNELAVPDNRLLPNRPATLERGNRILAELVQRAVVGALPPKSVLPAPAVRAEFNRD